MITPCVKYYNELNSTNSYALEHFEELNTGDIIAAKVQTHGRGRFDRVWEGSSPDNLYISFVIKPENPQRFPFANLTQYLSVVTNRVLNRDYGIFSNIKWPNDILFNGKKISGILAEAKMCEGKISGVVLGIGINVNFDVSVLENLPNATSISTILGKKTDKSDLLDKVTKEFFKNFDAFSKNGFSEIFEEYTGMCKFPNKKIKISASFQDGEYEFVRINEDGTISVKDRDKGIINIISGDIIC